MRTFRMAVIRSSVKPVSAYPALNLAAPFQKRTHAPRHKACKHHGGKTAAGKQKQARQEILDRHIHNSSASFHSMDMVPLRGAAEGTQRRERTNLMAESSAPELPEESSKSTWEGTPHSSTTTKIRFSARYGLRFWQNHPGLPTSQSVHPGRENKKTNRERTCGNVQRRIHHGKNMKIRILPHAPHLVRYGRQRHGRKKLQGCIR